MELASSTVISAVGLPALTAAKREKTAVAAVSFILMVGLRLGKDLSENGIVKCVRRRERRRKTGG